MIGFGIYTLGQFGVCYEITFLESFVFSSLISAVDPVATLAVFHSLSVDETLEVLCFGESVLNDAVAIVLYRTFLGFRGDNNSMGTAVIFKCIGRFFLISFGSVTIGIVFALASALLFKYTKLYNYPSLEFCTLFIFSYLPYLIAEGLELSGIMAILFCGIVMSHYTHYNLSLATRVTSQHTFRALAFIAENFVFASLGMAVFSFEHEFSLLLVSFILCTIGLCLVGRAANIFPLSVLVNLWRTRHVVDFRIQFVMWFSGLRGAIAFALAIGLTTPHASAIQTCTLCVVLFTVIVFGGGTLPVLGLLGMSGGDEKRVQMSKTDEMSNYDDDDEDEEEVLRSRFSAFDSFDTTFLQPIFRNAEMKKKREEEGVELNEMKEAWNANGTFFHSSANFLLSHTDEFSQFTVSVC